MPFNQFDVSTGFKAGAETGNKKSGLLDIFDEQRKADRELNTYRSKKEIDKEYAKELPVRSLYSFNPTSGSFEKVSDLPAGALVRNLTTPDDVRERQRVMSEERIKGKFSESGMKLGNAVKRLSLLNKQFDEAMPTSTNPLTQRIMGPLAVAGAQSGLAPNPRLMAIKRNSRPIAIQLVRAFGEVGNLTESEQSSALDTVSFEGLTEQERKDQVRQFAEFALSGANPESLSMLQKDPGAMKLIRDYGINLPQLEGMNQTEQSVQSQSGQPPIDIKQKYAQALAKYPGKKSAILAKYKQETGEDYV